ncbi:hypothetical protein [Streptomyces sp. NPDC000410]|uniref:hypothetical protein n=1 Tax=Streptomyces sp. NPDC000410 TaxID=3154254 RepID=UPI003325133F
MVGSLGMAGAGVAAADDSKGKKVDARECIQEAASANVSSFYDLPDVNIAVAVFGSVSQTNITQSNVAQTSVVQQICSNGDNSVNANAASVGTSQANQAAVSNLLDGFGGF